MDGLLPPPTRSAGHIEEWWACVCLFVRPCVRASVRGFRPSSGKSITQFTSNLLGESSVNDSILRYIGLISALPLLAKNAWKWWSATIVWESEILISQSISSMEYTLVRGVFRNDSTFGHAGLIAARWWPTLYFLSIRPQTVTCIMWCLAFTDIY